MPMIIRRARVRLRRASRNLLERLGLREPWPMVAELDRMTAAEREAFFAQLFATPDAVIRKEQVDQFRSSARPATRD